MNKNCLQCGTSTCYRWYQGPICANCYKREKYRKDPEKFKEASKSWRDKNPRKNAEACRHNYIKNKTKRIEKVKTWIAKNKDKIKQYKLKSAIKNRESIKDYQKKHYLENKALYRAKDAKYRANKLKATPIWADLEEIKQFYKNCPDGYHVDHIIPLQGKIVCGLHVIQNLQYLPARENLSKGNRYVA